ncbi:MurR/RpiR family transcriptional regulator [Lysinibacillus telephonicus]|uniref:MurR/RpiR family transcriptional regulator n=1 Tax=Lysinibacillus telephonicus TaxID=1714840 RepID=UPI0031FDC90B
MGICDDIKKRFIRLSRGQRKVAQFVIDNPNIIATHIASDVGKLIGVSESTVIRFCYAMELSGFCELQEKVKEDLMEKKESPIYDHPLLTKKHEHLVSEVMNRDITSILSTIQQVDEDKFEQAIKWMHEMKFLYVLGFRQSSPSANFLTSTLSSYRKHVKQIQHDVENIVQQISGMDDQSLLIVIALDTVLEDVLTITKLSKNKNAKVIAITSSNLSPIRDYADVIFTVGRHKHSSTEVITASHSLIHALIEGMVAQNKKQYTSFQKSNAQIESNFLFLDKAQNI